MSYILDALKKAEADQDPEARTSLALARHEQRRSRLLAYGLLVALIVNAIVLLWLFLPERWLGSAISDDSTRPPAAPVRPAEQAPAPSRTQPPVATGTTDEVSIRPISSNAALPQPVPLSRLPADVRRRFPDLRFSTHIYADAPDLRAIVVNGVRLEEGDRLENLRLQEITEEGAVFLFEQRSVSISVLDEWD